MRIAAMMMALLVLAACKDSGSSGGETRPAAEDTFASFEWYWTECNGQESDCDIGGESGLCMDTYCTVRIAVEGFDLRAVEWVDISNECRVEVFAPTFAGAGPFNELDWQGGFDRFAGQPHVTAFEAGQDAEAEITWYPLGADPVLLFVVRLRAE